MAKNRILDDGITKSYLKKKRIERLLKVATPLAAVVVFCVTYWLILPATAMQKQLICGKEEHVHTEDCYETQIIPGHYETERVEVDDTDDDYKDAELEEDDAAGDSVSDSVVIEDVIVDDVVEVGEPVNVEEAAISQAVFLGNSAESVDNTDTGSYGLIRTEHTRTETVEHWVPEHEEKVLICGLEEHTHNDSCYDAEAKAESPYHCGYDYEHIHGEVCYYEDGSLKCTLVEHTHTEECLNDTTSAAAGLLGVSQEDIEAGNVTVTYEDAGASYLLKADITDTDPEEYTWQWQYSLNGQDPWNNIEGATEITYEVKKDSEAMNWYIRFRGVKVDEASPVALLQSSVNSGNSAMVASPSNYDATIEVEEVTEIEDDEDLVLFEYENYEALGRLIEVKSNTITPLALLKASPAPTPLSDNETSGVKSGSKEWRDDSVVNITMTYASDKVTSDIESLYKGIDADDGKISVDKSVLYNDNDYYEFGSYDQDEFSVTLSAMAQQVLYPDTEQYNTPLDVVLLVDTSSSMYNGGQTRWSAASNACNTIVDKVMSYHPGNRIGIVTFNTYSTEILPLSRYYVGKNTKEDLSKYQNTTTGYGSGTQQFLEWPTEKNPSTHYLRTKGYGKTSDNASVLRYAQDTLYKVTKEVNDIVRDKEDKDPEKGFVTKYLNDDNENVEYKKALAGAPVNKEAIFAQGTYTQGGFKAAYEQFLEVAGKVQYYDESIGGYVTKEPDTQYYDESLQAYVTRKPVVIFISDGEPYSYVAGTTDEAWKNLNELPVWNTNTTYSVEADYYSILTGNTVKDKISQLYTPDAVFYSIGMGIKKDGNGNPQPDYAHTVAVLNPSSGNVAYCKTVGSASGASNKAQVAGGLHDRLTASGNPLGSNYAYVKEGFYEENYTTEQLTALIDLIVNNERLTKNYISSFKVQNSFTDSIVISDPIGEGMEIKGTSDVPNFLVLRAMDSNNPGTFRTFAGVLSEAESTDNEKVYRFGDNEIYIKKGVTVNTNNIKATVKKTNDVYDLMWELPWEAIPEISKYVSKLTGQTGSGNTEYQFELPIRLLYKVGLTDQSKKEIDNPQDTNDKVYYTNRYTENGESGNAGAVVYPAIKNTYYDMSTTISPKNKGKDNNPTETRGTYYEGKITEVTPGSGLKIENVLGNNGKLTFSTEKSLEKLKVKKIWTDEKDIKNHPEVVITLTDRNDSTGTKSITLPFDNKWEYVFEGLNNDHVYSLSEGSVKGYVLEGIEEVSDSSGSYWKITNAPKDKVDLAVTKQWEGTDSADKKEVTVHLYKGTSGTPVSGEIVYESNGSGGTTPVIRKLNAENGWTAEIKDLPRLEEGAYYISEDVSNLEGFSVTYEGGSTVTIQVGDKTYTAVEAEPYETVTVKNTRVQKINIEKVWSDETDYDHTQDVTVNLYRVPSEKVAELVGEPVVLKKGTEWKGAFENLPRLTDGSKYGIAEVVPEGYRVDYYNGTNKKDYTECTIKDSDPEEKVNVVLLSNDEFTSDALSLTIQNTRVQSITVTKNWVDKVLGEKTSYEVVIGLYKNTNNESVPAVSKIKEITLNAGNGWTDSFSDLEAPGTGESYYLYEEPKAGYQVEFKVGDSVVAALPVKLAGSQVTMMPVAKNTTKPFNTSVSVTNTKEYIDVKVKKNWEGKASQEEILIDIYKVKDGKAEIATRTILVEGVKTTEELKNIPIKSTSGWSETFTLEKPEAESKYYVVEHPVNCYVTTYTTGSETIVIGEGADAKGVAAGLITLYANGAPVVDSDGNAVVIKNAAGAELPMTGGIGTAPIYALGALLMCGLLFLL